MLVNLPGFSRWRGFFFKTIDHWSFGRCSRKRTINSMIKGSYSAKLIHCIMYIGNTAFVALRWNHPTSKIIRYSNKIPGWKIKVNAIPWIKMDKGWFSSRPWLFTEIVFIWLLSEWSTSQGILKSGLFVGFCSFSGGFEYEKYQIPNYTSQHEALSIFVAVEVHLANCHVFPRQLIKCRRRWVKALRESSGSNFFQDWQKKIGHMA